MDLTRTFQRFVVVLLIITVTGRFLNYVDLVVVFAGTLAPEITTVIGPLITSISPVAIVVAPFTTFMVVVPTMVIGFIVPVQWVLGA
jgi:hypothetical protein